MARAHHVAPGLALKRRALQSKLKVRSPARVKRTMKTMVVGETEGTAGHRYEPTISMSGLDEPAPFVTADDVPNAYIFPDQEDDVFDIPIFLTDIIGHPLSIVHEQPVQVVETTRQSEELMDNGSLEQNRAEGQSMEIDYPDQPQSQSEEQTPRPDFLQQSQSFPIVMAAKAGLQRREFLKEVRQRGKEFKEQQRTAGTVGLSSRNTSPFEQFQDDVTEVPAGWRQASSSTDHDTASELSTVRQQPQPDPSGNDSGSNLSTTQIREKLGKSPNRPATAGDLICVLRYIKKRHQEPSHRTRHRRARSSLSARRDAELARIKAKHNKIKRTTPKHRPQAVLKAQKHMRKIAMEMLKRKTNKDPFPRVPTAAEQAAFVRTGRGGPTVDDFRVDVMGQNREGPWNTAAAHVFAAEYTKMANALCRDVDDAADYFLTHIQALCKQYKRINQIPEDPEALAKNVRRARQSKTARRRLEVVLTTPELLKHVEWFDRLGIDGHSRDISSHGRMELRYIVQKLPWRSKKLDELLRNCDLIHLARRHGRNGRPKPGGRPRDRIRQDKLVDHDAEPIKGLPATCYATIVLTAVAEMPPEERREWDIQAPVSLTIPSRVLRRAARFAKVDGYNAVPLPDSFEIPLR